MVGMGHVLRMKHGWYGLCVEDEAWLVWVMC